MLNYDSKIGILPVRRWLKEPPKRIGIYQLFPSFCIILLISALLKTILQNFYVQAALSGLKPCIIGMILATGIYMVICNCVSVTPFSPDWKAVLITLLLFGGRFFWKRQFRKGMSPITLILLSAGLGILIYGT